MIENQPHHPEVVDGVGRFTPRPEPTPKKSLGNEEVSVSNRSEEKALQNLSQTVESMKLTLKKGATLVKLGRKRFDEDWLVQDAALIAVIQLAEDAKRLPHSFREERADIAWRQLIGMRNILTHEYADVDLSTVWTVLRDRFPDVERSLLPHD